MCQSCTDADPEWCARFYGIWCLLWGPIFSIACIINLAIIATDAHTIYSEEFYILDIILTVFSLIINLLYIVAGVLMYLGVNKVSQLFIK